jgi:hypothetical protein
VVNRVCYPPPPLHGGNEAQADAVTEGEGRFDGGIRDPAHPRAGSPSGEP